VVFPELSLSGYSLDDLHQQEALLRAVLSGIALLVTATASHPAILMVGAPIRLQGKLINCAVVMSGGRILGLVPKVGSPPIHWSDCISALFSITHCCQWYSHIFPTTVSSMNDVNSVQLVILSFLLLTSSVNVIYPLVTYSNQYLVLCSTSV
jgi:hypothetical protein